jgi:ABC-type transporter Mla MlaB component
MPNISSTVNGYSSKSATKNHAIKASSHHQKQNRSQKRKIMALQITNNSGIFEIIGNLNSQNVISLYNHFDKVLDRSKIVTLSLNNLAEIDKSAISAIASLYKKAMSHNKVLFIIGQENDKISAQFQSEKLSYILQRDVL